MKKLIFIGIQKLDDEAERQIFKKLVFETGDIMDIETKAYIACKSDFLDTWNEMIKENCI